MNEEASGEVEPLRPGRWPLIRDMLVLQLKLVVDGLRDFLLVPASLVAGIISLLSQGDDRAAFYRLVALGKRSEQWIDLFGALRNAPPDVRAEAGDDSSIDDLVQRVEDYVVAEYRSGGLTAQARARIDEALDALQRGSKQE